MTVGEIPMAGAGGSDWKSYLARSPRKVQRRIRKGIPDQLRGLAWQLISGGRDLLLQNEGAMTLTLVPLPFETCVVQKGDMSFTT